MKKREELKILLMQIRKDQESLDREYDAFVEFSGLRPDQIDTWKVFEESHFDPKGIHQYDALFAGGSSDDPKDSLHLDEERFPFITDAMNLFVYCKEHNIPVFASCMGLEIVLQALDEHLMFDKENAEMGFAEINLTEEGKSDPLFKDIPESFDAVSWHIKRAEKLPKGAVLLAESKDCPVHTFKFPGTKFYAFQFHPEWSDEALIGLLELYAERYPGGQESFEEVSKNRKATIIANSLVRKFVDNVILQPA